MSSVFGANTNFNPDARKTQKYFVNNNNGTSNEPRRNGNAPAKKKVTPKNGSLNSNGNKSNIIQGNNSNEKRRQDRRTTSKPNEFQQKSESPSASGDPLDKPIKAIPRQSPEKLQAFSQEEIRATGNLFPNPEQLGFQSKSKKIQARPCPKYLLSQPRLLYTPTFVQNAWDKQNQEKMLAIEAASTGSDYQGLYEEFQKMREVERRQMEASGLVDAENTRKDLNDAISFRGSCLDMCPTFERARRALENNVKKLERDPVTDRISRERAVKAFSRPAAGQPPPLPSDVRPPHVLVHTLNYLVDNIVHQLPEAHSFIWDRTRSIRQDFTYQNSFGPETIDCNERIVRIHLLSLHIMNGSDQDYSQQQELEQFNKALQTLIEIYDDVRNYGGNAPNEAEFRSYHLLSHIRDPELEKELQSLPNHIFQDKNVQLAIKLRNLISQNNVVERGYANSVGALNLFVEFFRVVYSEETPFLMACLLETRFNEFRFYALKAMSRSYHTKGKAYSAEGLKNLLGFDSIEKLVAFVSYYEIDIIHDTNGEVLVDLFNKEKLESKYKLNSFHEKAKKTQTYSRQLDLKIQGKTLRNFINQGYPNNDLGIKQDQKILDAASVPRLNSTVSNAPISHLSIPTQINTQTQGQTQTSIPARIPIQSATPLNNSSFGPSSNGFTQSTVAPSFSFSSKPQETRSLPPVQAINPVPTLSRTPTAFPKVQQSMSSTATSVNAPGFTSNPNASMFNSQTLPTVGHVRSNPIAPILSEVKTEKKVPEFKFGNSKPSFPAKPEIGIPTGNALAKIDPQPSHPTKISIYPSDSAKPIALTKAPSKPRENKLVDHPLFSKALDELVGSMIRNTVSQELEYTLPKLMQVHQAQKEREQAIDSLSMELYEAFLSEFIYQEALVAKAEYFHSRSLQRNAIRRLSSVGSALKQKQFIKRKKEDELNSVTFKVPQLKRRLSVSSNSSANNSFSSKRRTIHEGTFNGISKTSLSARQDEIHQLWAPLDLKDFVNTCSSNLKLNIETQNVELQFLLVVENWSSSYSKWLNSKLQLKSNTEKRIYENSVGDDKLILNFTSLPSNNYLNKDFFSKTSFILFECGLVNLDVKYPDINSKLEKDRGVLKKIASLAEKFSFYKVQILIIYWDCTDSKLSNEEISKSLGFAELADNENIGNIHLGNMSAQEVNINDILVHGFNDLKNNFNGDLTKRGLKRRSKVEKLENITKKRRFSSAQNLPLVAEDEASRKTDAETEELVKSKEIRLLEKAKRARHYNYLNNHARNSTSRATSSVNGPNVSANSSFLNTANKSILTHLTHLHHRNNSSIYNDTSSSFSSANTTMNNASILTGFGLGVIEESTPPTSPSSAPETSKPLPKNVQQLRDLTSGIRSRFKK